MRKLLILLVFASIFAQEATHEVKEGDTLWDISAMFLENPWLWPEIWHANPQVANPHLIYPGDLLTLVYIDGQPRLQVQRGYRTVKLSPHARSESLTDAIPTIPYDSIRQFLSGSDPFESFPCSF